MKFNLRKLAVVVALGGLSVGLIGQGLHAQFTTVGSAYQTISVDDFTLHVASNCNGIDGKWDFTNDNSGSALIRFAPVEVKKADGSMAMCNLTLTSTGGVTPDTISFEPKVNILYGAPELSLFDLSESMAVGAAPVQTYDAGNLKDIVANNTPRPIDWPSSGGVSLTPTLTWAHLTNTSLGTSFELVVKITAAQGAA